MKQLNSKFLVAMLLATLNCNISLAQKYVFYLHGRIVENQGAKAIDTINGYGEYRYQDILDSLSNRGFKVRSEVRAKNTQIDEYANKVSGEIEDLLKSGIPAKNITVIGASKGSIIAMHVSSQLKNKAINYVLMAGCGASNLEDFGENRLYGNILSIYEKSDGNGSCIKYKERSEFINKFKEIELNTGLRHGFIFKPIPEWLIPAVQWADGNRL